MNLVPLNGKRVSARELRRQLNSHAIATLQNDEVLDEKLARLANGLDYLASVLGRGFWGRLKWLALGK